jgi:hypothetical protein
MTQGIDKEPSGGSSIGMSDKTVTCKNAVEARRRLLLLQQPGDFSEQFSCRYLLEESLMHE